MKEKIFNKMIEYGWNLGANSYEDFNKVYDYHNTRFNKEWEQLEEKENRTELEELRVEDLRFITDFLRAIDDIDNAKKVSNSKISLYNSYDMPYSLSNMGIGDIKEVEYQIRQCNFNGNEICNLLNELEKKLIYNNWKIVYEDNNMITLRGIDISNNVVYLEISTQK